jgi:C_GCAxxG_C_C family probable redox protein
MGEKDCLSRRANLKCLGAMGAATLFGGTTEPVVAAEPNQAKVGKLPVDAVELAVARFGKGHSCAQAVFSAFAEQMGMNCETAVRLTAGLGAGMGMGSVCGAVSGAFLAIGLKYGGVEPKAKERTSKLARTFVERFKTRHSSVNCRELLGFDLSTAEGRKTANEKNLFKIVCTGLVRDAADILRGLLSEQKDNA